MEPPKKGSAPGVSRESAQRVVNTSKNKTFQRKKQAISFTEINARAIPVLPLLLLRWLPGGVMRGREYVVRNPKRADATPGSFSINTRTGKWADFASGDKGGDVISLAAYLSNQKQGEAANALAQMLGVKNHG
jgi:hypothetical protein